MTFERSACPRCGAPRTSSDPESPCPACLMRLALGPNAVPPAVPRSNGSSAESLATAAFAPTSAAPSIAELAALFPELEIRELIGRGGMGSVYLARQKSLDRLVALKIIRADAAADPGFAERFAREARALARLNHPNVVTVHDYGERHGTNYLVMEYVKGANVRQMLKAGRLDPATALAIVPPICDALQYAHEEGIVHRDIKPENLLIDERGRVKIADFGLAKLVKRTPAEVTLTGDLQALGTLHYMAPEQFDRPQEVDHRADIYALGVTLYEMLTGELPLGRYALPSRKSSVDARMDEVVLRAMEREPDLRYQSAYDVKSDVIAYSSSVAAVPAPQLSRSAGQVGRPLESTPTEEHVIPGIALTLVGMLIALFHLGTFIAMSLSHPGPDNAIKFVVFGLALLGLPMILGGILCVRSRGYELAVFGALAAMLPLTAFVLLSLPIGIWTLIVLRRRSVREAFVRASSMTLPPPQPTLRASFDKPNLADAEPSYEHVSPGVALAAAGGLIAVSHLALCAYLIQEDAGQPDWPSFLPLIGVAFAIPMIVGGVLCATSRSYELAIVATFTALLPTSLCLPLTLPLGAWAAVALHRPSVRAAFLAQRERRGLRSVDAEEEANHFSVWWRDLPRPLQLTMHTGLAIVYCLGLVGVFSFSGGRTPQEHYFTMGAPTPWLSFREEGNDFTQSILMSWSLVLGLIGLAALFGEQALTRIEGRRPTPLTLHYAIWGGLLAFAFTIGLVSVNLHRQNLQLPDGEVLIPPPTAPLATGVVAGLVVLIGSVAALIAGWLRTKGFDAEAPCKPLPEPERRKRVFWTWATVGLFAGFAAIGAVGWFAIYQYLSKDQSDSQVTSRPVTPPFVEPVHRGIARDVVVSNDGRFRLSVGDDGRIVWQDREDRDVWRSCTVEHDDGGPALLRDAVIAPDGKIAYVTGEMGMSRILKVDLVTRQVEQLPIRRGGNFSGLAVAADGQTISYVVGGTTFEVTEISSAVTFAMVDIYHGDQGPFGNVRRIASSPDGSLTAVTSSNLVPGKEPGVAAESAEPCKLSVFDRQGEEILNWIFPSFAEFSYAQIAFLDDRTLVAALPSGRLKKWTIRDGAWSDSALRISPGRYTAAARDFDGKHLWLAHDQEVVQIDAETGKAVAQAVVQIGSKVGDLAAEPIEALSATFEPRTVAVACWDGTVQTVVCDPLE